MYRYKPILTGKERGEEVKRNKEVYCDPYLYAVINSGLDAGENALYYHFAPVIENASSLREYIEGVLENKRGKAIGCEFGGQGYFFNEFTPGFFEKSVAVSLYSFWYNIGRISKNVSKKLRKPKTVKQLKSINHSIIKGNILHEGTYDFLSQQLSGQKIDLIIERMMLGLDYLPPNPFVIFSIFQKWYEMLNEEGLMLVEIPPYFTKLNLVDKWADLLNDLQKQNLIDYQIGHPAINNKVLRLIKRRGAPEKLPILTTKEVVDCLRESNYGLWF